MVYVNIYEYLFKFTPLKIYNETPSGVPLEIQGQQLPINELNGTPLEGACPISNLHRYKKINNLSHKIVIASHLLNQKYSATMINENEPNNTLLKFS